MSLERLHDCVDPFGKAAAVGGGLSGGAMRRALSYIDANLGEVFTLTDLASAAGVSRFHFARLFRVSTGMSPMVYLLHRRIERAQRLLLDRQATICAIATMLGFCDQSHFTRSFKRVTGTTPSAFATGCKTARQYYASHGPQCRVHLADLETEACRP